MSAPGDAEFPVDCEAWFKPGPVRDMPPAARGVYVDLLFYAWVERGIPQALVDGPQAKRLAAISNCTLAQWRQLWRHYVQARFVLRDGRYWHRRQLRAAGLAVPDLEARGGEDPDPEEDHRPEDTQSTLSTSARKKGGAFSGGKIELPLTLPLFAPAEQPELGQPKSERERDLVLRHLVAAHEVLAWLNDARKRVHATATGIRPTFTSLAGIARALDSGRTLPECLQVIEACEADCRRRPEAYQWFDAVSPWRPVNFERWLARGAQPLAAPARGMAEPSPASEIGEDAPWDT